MADVEAIGRIAQRLVVRVGDALRDNVVTPAERDQLLEHIDALRSAIVRAAPQHLPPARRPSEAHEVLYRVGIPNAGVYSANAVAEIAQLCHMRDVVYYVHDLLGIAWGDDLYAAIANRPDYYRTVQKFNAMVVGPEVDRTHQGPSWPSNEGELQLGCNLLLEEVQETVQACGYAVAMDVGTGKLRVRPAASHVPSLEEALDGVCDVLYVLFGLALRLGFEPGLVAGAWDEVTRANMDKANGPLREDGKRLKPEGWRGPDLLPLLVAYMPVPDGVPVDGPEDQQLDAYSD